jgi:hypothetical protein
VGDPNPKVSDLISCEQSVVDGRDNVDKWELIRTNLMEIDNRA